MKYHHLLLAVTFFSHSIIVFGHGDEKHDEDPKPKAKFEHESLDGEKKDNYDKDAFKKINIAYQNDVKPIFENSCFNCHSQEVKYPWYYEFPIVKSIIDEDIKEARTHLLFGEGFPFKGHGEPVKDLKAIAKATSERDMPPLEYVLMHPSSYLNEQEQATIKKWVKESLELLK